MKKIEFNYKNKKKQCVITIRIELARKNIEYRIFSQSKAQI